MFRLLNLGETMSAEAKVLERGTPTKLLAEAMVQLEGLPGERQDEIARRLLDIVETDRRIESGELTLTAEQQAEVDAALAEDGPYVSDSDMEVFFAQYRR